MPIQRGAQPESEVVTNPEHQAYYSSFVQRYYPLFRTKFEPFRQKEDKQLTRDEFDDSFVKSTDRLKSAATGELDFQRDKADIEGLLTVMSEAAALPATRQRLEGYKGARKVRIAKKVQRSRTETRRGWDPYDTSCPGWYNDPVGCAPTREVEVPYTEIVYSMQFPAGTQSHSQVFRAYQERYLGLLDRRRETNARVADEQRMGILAGIGEGKVTLVTALQMLGGFLVLMFFFLLIAIERHQRRLSAQV